MNPEHEKLMYISKSKKQCYDSCPLAFRYNYIDKLPQKENPWFITGIDVHEFIDHLFDVVIPLDDGELQNISQLKYHPNGDYKKNVVKFEIQRWKAIHDAGFDKSFFIPVEKEKKWQIEKPKLIGIVDRVHKCCKADPFAPNHPEFENSQLVITENKTGVMTKAKCHDYEKDLLWYKIIMEIAKPELAPIKWGAIYFPESNHVHHCELTVENCRKLAKEINKVREKIRAAIESNDFPATPSKKACEWCQYKSNCEKRWRD